MTIKGPYLILTNPDTLINTTANRLTRSHIRTEVSLSGYNVNTGFFNDPSLCHKIKNIKLEQKNDRLISDLILLKSKKKILFLKNLFLGLKYIFFIFRWYGVFQKIPKSSFKTFC